MQHDLQAWEVEQVTGSSHVDPLVSRYNIGWLRCRAFRIALDDLLHGMGYPVAACL